MKRFSPPLVLGRARYNALRRFPETQGLEVSKFGLGRETTVAPCQALGPAKRFATASVFSAVYVSVDTKTSGPYSGFRTRSTCDVMTHGCKGQRWTCLLRGQA